MNNLTISHNSLLTGFDLDDIAKNITPLDGYVYVVDYSWIRESVPFETKIKALKISDLKEILLNEGHLDYISVSKYNNSIMFRFDNNKFYHRMINVYNLDENNLDDIVKSMEDKYDKECDFEVYDI